MAVLDALPVFLAAVDTGSIQGAARQLELARPTVRRRLEALEAELGVALLERGARGLRPTPAGKLFEARARAMVAELEGVGEAVRAAAALPRGVLRVGVPSGLPVEIVGSMSDAMGALWPDVRLELVCSTEVEDLVERVDCRFAFELDDPEGSLVSVDLGTVREQLVASAEYLAAHEPIREVADLANHKLFCWLAPDTRTPERLPVMRGPEPRVAFAMATNEFAPLVWLARQGRGLVFMPFDPAMARPPFMAEGELVPVLGDIVGRERPRRLVAPQSLAGGPIVAAFLEQTRMVASTLLGI